MPTVSLTTAKPTTADAEVLVLGIRSDDDRDVQLGELLTLMGFTGEKNQIVSVPSNGTVKAPRVMAVALPAEPTAEDLRRAAGRAVRALKGVKSAAFALHPATVEEVAAIAEGIHLGAYAFNQYKSKKKGKKADQPVELGKVAILSAFARQKIATKAVDDASVVAQAVNMARDWVNMPPGDLRPPTFAQAISDHSVPAVKVTIWDEKRLAKENCGGILGVGQGSDAPPRLVRLTYSPENAVSHLALVGKGITFDSGGLSIKPGASMQTMKCDMGGAAAIAAATVAIARLGLPIAVTGFACIAENMPSGSATRPGDVLTMRSGATVEVHNTDAEGRLVLADGLALAGEAKADHIVDVATLTGAAVVALGNYTSAVLGNNGDLIQQVVDSSLTAGESMWHLPITEEMQGLVRSSNLADLRQHNPKPAGGTLFAAAFLREFIPEGTPWAHLDIAGPAFNDGGASDYTPTGGTGAGVRTLIKLAETLSAK